MSLKTNPFLRLSMIGALALATAPAVPHIALAAGASVDHCAGTADIQGARLGAGETIFFGWVDVAANGDFRWTCSTGAAVTTRETDCGIVGAPMRWVRAELRDGVLYVACN